MMRSFLVRLEPSSNRLNVAQSFTALLNIIFFLHSLAARKWLEEACAALRRAAYPAEPWCFRVGIGSNHFYFLIFKCFYHEKA